MCEAGERCIDSGHRDEAKFVGHELTGCHEWLDVALDGEARHDDQGWLKDPIVAERWRRQFRDIVAVALDDDAPATVAEHRRMFAIA